MKNKDFTAKEIGETVKSEKTGALENVDISIASNGFSVRVRKASKPSKGGECAPYHDPATMVFQTKDALIEWLSEEL